MHHNNTPASVLEAPKQTVKYIHENTGSNRRERRHGYTKTGKHYIIPKEYRDAATNTPFRGKKNAN
jgi:hypothetical protein